MCSGTLLGGDICVYSIPYIHYKILSNPCNESR